MLGILLCLYMQKLIEQMKNDEFLYGKTNYKYQPSSPVNLSLAVSAQSLCLRMVSYVVLLCYRINYVTVQGYRCIIVFIVHCLQILHILLNRATVST